MTPRPFDPELDFPPNGATVGDAVFGDHPGAPFPCWMLPDGRIARPFDDAGIALARFWARNGGVA